MHKNCPKKNTCVRKIIEVKKLVVLRQLAPYLFFIKFGGARVNITPEKVNSKLPENKEYNDKHANQLANEGNKVYYHVYDSLCLGEFSKNLCENS